MRTSSPFAGLVLLLAVSSGIAQAQSQGTAPAPPTGIAKIIGRVIDPKGRAIIDAAVETENRPGAAVRTDSTGHFTVAGVPEGQYMVTVRRIGFGPKQAQVNASKNHPSEALFVLEPTAQQLAAITIETRPWVPLEYRYTHRFDSFFENRHAAMGGVFYTKEDIERMGGFHSAMNRIPGIKMRYGPFGRLVLNMDRCADDKIMYIINDLEDPAGLSGIIPEQIETLEVYQGITTMPARARGTSCAAVVIQTK